MVHFTPSAEAVASGCLRTTSCNEATLATVQHMRRQTPDSSRHLALPPMQQASADCPERFSDDVIWCHDRAYHPESPVTSANVPSAPSRPARRGMRLPASEASRLAASTAGWPPSERAAPSTTGREATGSRLLFMPTYSLDLNPILQAFAKTKAALRRLQTRTPLSLVNAIADRGSPPPHPPATPARFAPSGPPGSWRTRRGG